MGNFFEVLDATFSSGNDHEIKNTNFAIPKKGNIVCLLGPSGAGKTTLGRLLQGLIKPSSGQVEVDGNNLVSLDLNFYRQQVCMIDNAPTFFSGSIEENIRRARPNISSDEFDEILNISGLATISNSLPDGLATRLDVTGSALSHSHKVIVALARGLATAPNLVLIDEAVNNLDKFSQMHFMDNLDQMCAGKTLIMVSNDLRFMPGFDWILVMESGEIKGQGTHQTLLNENALYQRLYESEKALSTF